MDLSVMGAGKTYTTSYLSLQPQFLSAHMVVICPVNVQPKWNSMGQKHGVPLKKCISYHSLRAAKGKQPAHGLLHRFVQIVNENGRRVNKVSFKATEEFVRGAGEGLLLVVDKF